ncbi:MAG: OstA-like protein [Chitinophagaceae bacterium]
MTSIRIVLCSILYLSCIALIAQDKKEKSQPIELLHADSYRVIKINDSVEFRYLVGNVFIRQGDIFFMSDSMIENLYTKTIECFGNNQIIKDDTNRVFADYIQYFINTKIAFLAKNVILKSGQATLETPNATYDAGNKIFSFEHTGILKKDSIVVTSQKGLYNQKLQKSVFYINTHLIHPEFILYADSLAFFPSNNTIFFISPSVLETKDNKQKIYAIDGFYNIPKEYILLTQRSFIWDSSSCAIADTIESFKNKNHTFLRNNGYVFDTVQKSILVAQHIFINDSIEEALATIYPYWVYYNEKDTTVLRADTFWSKPLKYVDSNTYSPLREKMDSLEKINKNPKFMLGYHNVRGYNDSMQLYCDSLFYSDEDSVMRLIKRPIMWNINNQITGDTIYLYFDKKEPQKMHIPHFNFIIRKEFDTNIYSQIKSENNWTYFSKNNIDSIWLFENVQVIYYSKDDSNALAAISYITSDSAFVKFNDSKIVRLKFLGNYKGLHYPPEKYPSEKKFLENFKCLDSLRPTSMQYVINYLRLDTTYRLQFVYPKPFFPNSVIKRPDEDYRLIPPKKQSKNKK